MNVLSAFQLAKKTPRNEGKRDGRIHFPIRNPSPRDVDYYGKDLFDMIARNIR